MKIITGTRIMEISNLLSQAQDQLKLLEKEINEPEKRLQPIMFFTIDALRFPVSPLEMTINYDQAWADINTWLNNKIGKQLIIEKAIIVAGDHAQADYMQAGAMKSIYEEMQERKLIDIADRNVIYDCAVWASKDDIGPTGVYGSDFWGVPPPVIGRIMHSPGTTRDLARLPKEDPNAILWSGATSWPEMGKGRLTHEVCHVFGLSHRPQQPASEPQTVMDAWWIFPNLVFIPKQIDVLNKSPFLR